MKMTIKTTELQEMVGKAIKCVSNNKLIPLTSLMNIKVESNKLTLTTTDATNYLYVSTGTKVDCEDFEVSVVADLFTKLVQKSTSDTIELSVEGNILKVKSNGNYTLELPLDENGSVIKFPRKLNDDFRNDAGGIKLSTIKNIIIYNKASLSTNMDFPALTSYYCGDTVLTSDRKKICRTGIKLFETPFLISSQLMELLGNLTDEDIQVTTTENDIVFTTVNDIVYAPILEGVETFPNAAIEQLVEQDFQSSCKISRVAIMNVLDRLALFVAPYDKQGIYLTFTKDGIIVSSKKSSGQELIPYVTSENFADYTCCINIEMLRSQVATSSEDEIELHYGSDIAVKLVNKNVVQIVALLEDDRVEN